MPGRVTTRREFDLLAKPQKVGRSGPLRVSFVTGANEAKVAYAIGKPVGNAVVRNRIRRRIRALLDQRATPLPAGIYLIRVGKGAENCSYDELAQYLNRAILGL
jgi:ribonuclease P protein component